LNELDPLIDILSEFKFKNSEEERRHLLPFSPKDIKFTVKKIRKIKCFSFLEKRKSSTKYSKCKVKLPESQRCVIDVNKLK
jgi:hypothetical protein